MQIADIGGTRIHYRERGPRGAPALVFANSLGTDFRIWDKVVARLGERFRIVTYDKRGHGLSDAPAAPYVLADHVGDLAGLLAHLEVTNATVCGLSVGGMIAQALAADHPGLVSRLILCDTAHKIGPPENWEKRMAAVREGGIEVLADTVMGLWFSAAFHAGRADELRGWRHMLVRTPVDGYVGTCAALRDADLTATSAKLDIPTLCLCGSDDGATTPDLVRSTADLIPGARFELIEGAGHLPCIEAPNAVAGLILAFTAEGADG